MARSASVAILGATGLVGRQLIDALAERRFPLSSLELYASPRTAGQQISCGALTSRVELLDTARFADTEIVIAAMGIEASAEWIPRAVEAGAIVIDLSQVYIDDSEVPVVVPEVNAPALSELGNRRIVTSPDAVALAAAVALAPLQREVGVRRIVLTTFEPVSGAGAAGIEELQQQTTSLMSGEDAVARVFEQRIAFNVIPQLGEILAGGSTRGEIVAATALRRLVDLELAVSVTRVRVPTFYGLALAMNVETLQPITAEEVHEVLRAARGVLLAEAVEAGSYPTAADTVGEDSTLIGRVRCDPETSLIDLWVAVDNMRKGSAVNAVQIAEIVLRDHL